MVERCDAALRATSHHARRVEALGRTDGMAAQRGGRVQMMGLQRRPDIMAWRAAGAAARRRRRSEPPSLSAGAGRVGIGVVVVARRRECGAQAAHDGGQARVVHVADLKRVPEGGGAVLFAHVAEALARGGGRVAERTCALLGGCELLLLLRDRLAQQLESAPSRAVNFLCEVIPTALQRRALGLELLDARRRLEARSGWCVRVGSTRGASRRSFSATISATISVISSAPARRRAHRSPRSAAVAR